MQKVSVKEKIGYGLGDTASNIVFQLVISFMFIFYTDVFGLPAAAVGTLLLVVRIFDGISDPIMGGIADRTNTRWGKYRPFLIICSIPYALFAVLAFYTPDLDSSGKLIYAYVTYALLMIAYTAINIPYSALGGVITSSTTERASVQSWRFALAMTGGLIVASSTLPLVDYLGGGNKQIGFTYAMMVLSTFAVVCFFGCFYLTKERVKIPPQTAKYRGIKGIFRDAGKMLQNDQWRIIAIVSFVLSIAVFMRGAALPYYVSYYLQLESLITIFISISMIAGILGAILANYLTRYMCKISLMKYCAIAMILVNGLLFFVPQDAFKMALVLTFLVNFVHMIFTPLLFSTVPDTADYGRRTLGHGAMGMAISGHVLSTKIGLALGGALTGYVLSSFGYQANAEQTESALAGILILYSLASVIAGAFVFGCMRFYKLTRDYTQAQ